MKSMMAMQEQGEMMLEMIQKSGRRPHRHGLSRKTGIKEHLQGGTADRFIRHAICDVLIVRDKG